MLWKHPSLSIVFLSSLVVVAASIAVCSAQEEVHESVQGLLQKAIEDSRAQLAQLDLSQDEVDRILWSTFSTQLPSSVNEKQSEEAEAVSEQDPEAEDPEEEDSEEEDSEEEDLPEIDPLHSFYYADRHVLDVLSILNDPDCMSREFDAKADDFDDLEASDVLLKCRLLVLRNAFDPDMILKKFNPAFTQYLNALKQDRIEPRHRVIYDPHQPTKRYEIMLPEQLAFDELVRDPTIRNIVGDPMLLDRNFFLHSLGTVVTEPGAPHQTWHEEDNYIFNSFHSFADIGVGGHDLPPYVINAFTPLLNLTHNHGPTEFCVGTSATTGLLDGNFDVYDKSILDDEAAKEAFMSTISFHRQAVGGDDQKPCPPKNLRSVLLNVGDAVLFDYQIIHRAGHNLVDNEDTRTQIYMAFARKWFRDLNYDANWVDYDDEQEDPDAYDPFTRQTRFAPDTDDEALFEDGKKEFTPIESLRRIVPQRRGHRTGWVEFVLSNIDLEEGTVFVSSEGAEISDGGTEELVAPGEHHVVRAKVGSRLSLLDAAGKLLKSWKVPYFIDQLAVSKEIVGLAAGPDGVESEMEVPQEE